MITLSSHVTAEAPPHMADTEVVQVAPATVAVTPMANQMSDVTALCIVSTADRM